MRAVPPSPDPRPGGQGQQAPHAAVLDGVLERVTFCNPETGYTIARVAPDRGTGRGPGNAGQLIDAAGGAEGASVLRPPSFLVPAQAGAGQGGSVFLMSAAAAPRA
jgi:hypothetical protein